MGLKNGRRRLCFCVILLILLQTMPQFAFGLKYLQPQHEGSSFKIAIFADLHFGENAWTDWGPKQDVDSIKAMSSLLDQENPDFVVYLGDVVTANNVGIANASLYWDQAISPTRDRGIPWATVFGNHDDAHFEWPKEWFSRSGVPPLYCPSSDSSYAGDEKCSFKGTTRLELMTHELSNITLSFSQHGPRHLWPSVSNYVLQISSSGDLQLPVAFMYFLDSGGGSYPQIISEAQAEWFKAKSEEINPHSRVPEIVFWHIPSKAYQKVAPPRHLVPWPCKGSINKEGVCTQEGEMGIMKILAARPSVQAIFVGHDHGNDWCCPYKKMWLCYARHTGYGGYGNWPRGARILEVVERPFSLKSWIRMENGAVHSHVLLSSHSFPVYFSSLFFCLVLLLMLLLGIKFFCPTISSKAKLLVSPLTR